MKFTFYGTFTNPTSETTYLVSGGALNSTHSLSLTHSLTHITSTSFCLLFENMHFVFFSPI